jgi:hypothetical protein
MQKWITPGSEISISTPILSYVTDVTSPAIGEPFFDTGFLDHRALVDRVNQDFASSAEFDDSRRKLDCVW